MTTGLAFVFWIFVVIGVVGIVLMIRNQCVFKVRIAFLHESNGLKKYERLPSYGDMLERPRYWHLWTKAHWDRWLEVAA